MAVSDTVLTLNWNLSDTALFSSSEDGLGECVRHVVDVGTCK